MLSFFKMSGVEKNNSKTKYIYIYSFLITDLKKLVVEQMVDGGRRGLTLLGWAFGSDVRAGRWGGRRAMETGTDGRHTYSNQSRPKCSAWSRPQQRNVKRSGWNGQ